jgi:hypothetical protein
MSLTPGAGYCQTCRIWFAAFTGADRLLAERIGVRQMATRPKRNGWRRPAAGAEVPADLMP